MNLDSRIRRRKSRLGSTKLSMWIALALLLLGACSYAYPQDQGHGESSSAAPSPNQSAGGSTCPSDTVNTKLPAPKLNPITVQTTTATATLTAGTTGAVQICDGGVSVGSSSTSDSSGMFSIPLTKTLKAGDQLQAQLVVTSADGTKAYGAASAAVTVASAPKSPSPTIVMIAGYEQAGYSAMGQNGNAFVDLFYGGPPSGKWSGWGNVRLLGAPQATTQGIAGSFTNPEGQITTQSYTTVGQAMDFMLGPAYKLPKYWSLIAELGATTPLSSQNTPLTFVVPPAGTVECSTLVSRFSPQNGYNPGLAASTTPGTCLQGGYTNIAFANQDRSNFLLKYAAGLRSTLAMPCKGGTATQPCSDSYALLDVTLGQDEAISGGRLHSAVLKLDAELPVPIAGSSWLYLFGSAYLRLQGDVQLSPLILQVPTTPVTVPSPSVFVLPLRQPNRDYFRLGIGLNLSQVFCKISTSTCPNSNSGTGSASGSGSSPASAPSGKKTG